MSPTTRTFEYQDDKSSKFWEITQAESSVTVRFGKVGTQGQSQEKSFEDAAVAAKHAAKLIAEKTGKGYVERSAQPSGSAPSSNAATETEAKPTPATKAARPGKATTPSKPKSPAQDPEASADSLLPLLDKDDATNRLLAKHPKASAELLEKLSHSSDKATRQAVVLNPNTPKATLVRLAPQFPADFFKNPAFDWLLLEDPNLLTGLGGGVFKNILKRDECPVSFLKWAAMHGDESQQLAVAMNPNTPEESLRLLLKSGREAVRAAAAAHTNLAQAEVGEQFNAEAEFVSGIAQSLSRLPVDDARELLDKGYLGVHHLTAMSKAVHYLSLDLRNLEFLVASYGRSLAWPIVLEKRRWLDDPDRETELNVLKRGTASDEFFGGWIENHGLSKGNPRDFSGDPHCPVIVLEALASTSLWTVRLDVANNQNCPQQLLEKLAKDPHSNVRHSVAGNPNCPIEVLNTLTKDPEKHIRELAILRLEEHVGSRDEPISNGNANRIAGNHASAESLLMALASHKDTWIRCVIANNHKCPPSVFEFLSKDKNTDVRVCVALSPQCPAQVLVALAKDTSAKVRCEVAANLNCPNDVLVYLLEDPDPRVRREALARHPTKLDELLASDEAIASWIRGGGVLMPWMPKHRDDAVCELLSPTKILLSKGTGHKNSLIRALALSQPAAGVEALAKNQSHVDWLVRAAVARNRNCPQVVLNELAGDPHKVVAALAQVNAAQGKESQQSAIALKGGLRQVEPELHDLFSKITDDLKKVTTPSVLMSKALMHWLPVKQKNALLDHISDELARSTETSGATLDRLARSKNEGVRRLVAENPSCPPEALAILVKDKDSFVRREAISNAGCSLQLLEQLVAKGGEEVRRTVALNKNCSRSLLTILASDKVDDVRAMAALNSSCPMELLDELANDRSYRVRSMVAANEKCPLPLLKVLACDKNADVRRWVGGNRRSPPELLSTLATDSDWQVRRAVVNNENCSKSLLKTLSSDKEGLVAADAEWKAKQPVQTTDLERDATPKQSPEFLESIEAALQAMIKTPPPALTLADCIFPNCPPKLKFLAPLQPDCPKDQLFKAANSPEPLVRLAAALNPQLPRAQVMRLLSDEDINVQRAAACHPHAA